MSAEKVTKKNKKRYTTPQLITYGAIASLTQGNGSQIDGTHAAGQTPGTIPPPFPTPTPGMGMSG